MELHEISAARVEEAAKEHDLPLPVEQTEDWCEYESTITDRTYWGSVAFEQDGRPVAAASFMDYETHGYHYLRGHHAPVWLVPPTADREEELARALVAYVKRRDPKVAFIRMAVEHEIPSSRPVLSTSPYNQTVVIDLDHGDADEILSKFKTRGRRDVRKSLRESNETVADETTQALEDFAPYYAVMEETCARDGFTPSPAKDYVDMLKILGPDRARLTAGRIDGELACWALNVIEGTRATRYYGASRMLEGVKNFVDAEVFETCLILAGLGCTTYDLMGIGNDFSPNLKGLNMFKTKFSKDVVDVAPDRDIPVKGLFYKALKGAKRIKDR